MTFPEYFGEANEMGLKDLKTLKCHVYEGWAKWRVGKRIAVWASIIAYAAVVAYTTSMLVTVAGGAILVALRLWSIESEVEYRLNLFGDLSISLQNHSQAAIEAAAREVAGALHR